MIFAGASNRILDMITQKGSNVDYGSAIWIGLSTTTPLADGTGITEPSGNGYARVFLGIDTQSYTNKFASAVNGEAKNAQTIFFPKATGAWGTITHAVIFVNNSAVDPLAGSVIPVLSAALVTPISPVANEVAIIEPNNLVLTLV